MNAPFVASPPIAPVANAAEAEALILHLMEVMDGLLDVVQEETKLVRAGQLGDARRLADAKVELAQRYVADTLRLKASNTYLKQTVPEIIEALRKRHDLFHALLQMNLTVLATAQAVSEGIVRGVSDELTRKAAPSTYGASGRTNAPAAVHAQPLALSRVL